MFSSSIPTHRLCSQNSPQASARADPQPGFDNNNSDFTTVRCSSTGTKATETHPWGNQNSLRAVWDFTPLHTILSLEILMQRLQIHPGLMGTEESSAKLTCQQNLLQFYCHLGTRSTSEGSETKEHAQIYLVSSFFFNENHHEILASTTLMMSLGR